MFSAWQLALFFTMHAIFPRGFYLFLETLHAGTEKKCHTFLPFSSPLHRWCWWQRRWLVCCSCRRVVAGDSRQTRRWRRGWRSVSFTINTVGIGSSTLVWWWRKSGCCWWALWLFSNGAIQWMSVAYHLESFQTRIFIINPHGFLDQQCLFFRSGIAQYTQVEFSFRYNRPRIDEGYPQFTGKYWLHHNCTHPARFVGLGDFLWVFCWFGVGVGWCRLRFAFSKICWYTHPRAILGRKLRAIPGIGEIFCYGFGLFHKNDAEYGTFLIYY